MKRFTVLDSFRGLFALSVVVFHASFVGSVTELSFFQGSAIFVDFFFILSGFVIAHVYAYRKVLSFREYAITRTFRLFPLHIFMLMAVIVLEVGKLSASSFGLGFNHPPFSGSMEMSGFFPNLFLLQSWLPWSDGLTFNQPAWSVSIEYYVCMIFFVTLTCFRGRRELGWLLICVLMLSLILIEADFPGGAIKRGLSGFFAGAFTYTLYRKWGSISPSVWLASAIEVMCLVLVVFVVSLEFLYKPVVAPLFFCGVILCFSFERGVLSRALKARFFVRLGELSYSIYLTHGAVLFVFTSIVIVLEKVMGYPMAPVSGGVRALDFGAAWLNNAALIFVLLSVCALSTLTYRYVEKPGLRAGKKVLNRYH